MRRVFVDTAHYVALLNTDDANHTKAFHIAQELIARRDVRFVTTDGVLVETLTYASRRGRYSRDRCAALVDLLRRDTRTAVLDSTRELFDRALDLYRRRPDKTYSMTDCMSMVVYEDERIGEVLTADKDFEQEGLTILL